MRKTQKLSLCLIVALAALGAVSLHAWENPVTIDGGNNSVYDRPTLKFGPSGTAYIVYQIHNNTTGRNDILVRSYDGKNLSKVMVVTEGMPYSNTPEWPDIAVTASEELHVAWAEHNRSDGSQFIKYRYYNGTSWGAIETLVQTANYTSFGCEDIHIAADNSNNAFICFYDPNRGMCSVITKYFGKKPSIGFPVPGRSKHCDISANEDYIHIAWQHLMDPDYGILYQRKQNKEGAKWQSNVNLSAYYTQRPRVDVDNDGNPFVAFWEDRGLDRRLWLRNWHPTKGLTDRDSTILLSSENYEVSHFLDFSIKNNVMFATWQQGDYFNGFGGSIRYAWKKGDSSNWLINQLLPGTVAPALTTCDLTSDGSVAGAAAPAGLNSIMLYLSDKIVSNNLPKAVISADKDEIFWNEEVSFNGSGSSDSDGSIVGYSWRVVQDKVTLTGSSVTYKFNNKYGAVRVRLTVTDDKGGKGIADKIITVKALYTARAAWTWQKIKTLIYNREGNVVTWEPNAKNEAAGYNIVKYRIFRKATGGAYEEIGEVPASKRTFADVSAESGKTYTYAVAAVDDQDRQSPYDNF